MSRSPLSAAAMKRMFLEAFAQSGTLLGASKLSGVDDRYHHRWLAKSESYRQAFDIAKSHAADTLEAEARRRACDGYDDPIMYNGVQVGTVKRYSDLLMIFLLKAARPDTFRDYHSVNVKGSLNATATVTVVHEFRDARGTIIDASPVVPQLPPAPTSDDSE